MARLVNDLEITNNNFIDLKTKLNETTNQLVLKTSRFIILFINMFLWNYIT